MRIEIKRGNDQIVTLPRLRVTNTLTYLNAATVKGTLYDSRGVAIPAFTNVTMAYVTDSDGTYEWVIDGPTMMLPPSKLYQLVITGREAGKDYRNVYDVTVGN
jgi:hypothetical protein